MPDIVHRLTYSVTCCERPRKPPRLAAAWRDPGCRASFGVASRGGEHPPRSRLRLRGDPPEAAGSRSASGDLREGQASCPPERNRTMDRRTHELLAKRPQEACVVHGTTSASGRLLDGLLEGGDHSRTPRPRGLQALSLGRPTPTPTMPIGASS